MHKPRIFCLFVVFLVFISFTVFSQPVPQTSGGILQQEEQRKKTEDLQKRITTERETPTEEVPEEVIPEDEGEKIMVTTITVEGVTLVPQESVDAIVSQYQGQELSLKGMQKVADLVTDEYRKRGYATSRAYIPPQTIREGVLIIRVVEGLLGSLEIRGNRYFKTSLLQKRIQIKPGEPFDYEELQNALTYINEHPDRKAKVVLVPGTEPGTTDVILEVKDNFPFHIGYEYDNYNSRFLDKYRYSAVIEHNNLFGFDDKLYFKYQTSEGDFYRLKTARYSFPITNTIEVGMYLVRSHSKLGREFEIIDSRGSVENYGIFLNKTLIQKPDLDLRLNFGFDYKDIKNYLLGILNSHDELRIFKTGFDLDVSDKWGRSIFTAELDSGVPNMFGGMGGKVPASVFPGASREGAGGRFYKGVFNLFRFQPGPFGSAILVKNQGQFSNYNLCASEEFQIGGPLSVRGYPPAEFAADSGLYSAFEWSFPFYLAPQSLKVPFTQDKLREAFHIVGFYDWATVHLNKVLAGDQKKRTLKSAGAGCRLNLTNDLSARIEFGYPLGRKSSDDKNLQKWIEFTFLF